MIPYLKALLYDKQAFVAAARALLVILGMAIEQNEGFPVPWIGYGLVAAGLMIRSSVSLNQPKAE